MMAAELAGVGMDDGSAGNDAVVAVVADDDEIPESRQYCCSTKQ